MKGIEERILVIQQGDIQEREKIIREFKPLIYSWASHHCRRSLDWSNDDELSIALLAFNEAMETYNIKKGANFANYANLVIKHRLIDYFKKERRHNNLNYTLENEEGEEYSLADIAAAQENFALENERKARKEEIKIYQQKLQEYHLSFAELVSISPKHKKTRESLIKAALILVNEKNLVAYLQRTKRLPVKELTLLTGLNRKVIERGRKYIIAITLLFLEPELIYLRNFIENY